MDKRNDVYRTVDAPHQGVWIMTKKDMVRRYFKNEEPYMIALEMNIPNTYLIGIYVKDSKREEIINQLWTLLNRIRIKHDESNIIVFGDMNTGNKMNIKLIEKKTGLKWSDENIRINTREHIRKGTMILSTLDYFITSNKIWEMRTIQSHLSDHKPLIAKIEITENKQKHNRAYYHYCTYKVTKENITKTLNTKWPDECTETTRLFKNRITLRPVIKIQNLTNKIFKEKSSWTEKEAKLKEVKKESFREYISQLNLSREEDKSRFYKIMNTLVKYKTRSHIAIEIKTNEGILYGNIKDRIIKTYFEIYIMQTQNQP